jgi:lysophospholipase L1-like esterase
MPESKVERKFKRYVAIGDSMTEGLFDPDGSGGNRGWADRLAERIAAARGDILYANLAVRGRRAHEIRAEQLGSALALEPDLVSVVAGMNDLLRPSFDVEQVVRDIDHMLAVLTDAGATVLTMTYGDPVPINPYARVLRKRMDALNEQLRVNAARRGAVLVDFADEKVVSDARFWCDDRLHANSEGHVRIAAAAAEALGLEVGGPRWNEPLPPAERRRRREQIARELAWGRQYLAPWVVRRFRRVSSGDGVQAKRPDLAPVDVARGV